MQKEQLTLRALIRSSLWGKEPPDDPGAAEEEARAQALIPLLFPDTAEARRQSAHHIRILFAQDEILELFRSAGIPAIILKGSAAAYLYPDPLRRTMGDIDLIVPEDRFSDACGLAGQNGYVITPDTVRDPRHKEYVKDGIHFEIHRHFSFGGIDVEKYVTDGLSRPETVTVEGHAVPIAPPLENGMILLAHAAGHLKGDLGLRQIIDWMMYVHACLSDEAWNGGFREAAASCGLEKFAVTATRLCRKYLGLPDPITWCDGADEEVADALLESLLATGNFGRANSSGSNVEKVSVGIKRFGFFRYLKMAGEHNWKAYHRHKWLKPLCPVYQIFRYAKQSLTVKRGKKLSDDLDRAASRYELLKKLGLE